MAKELMSSALTSMNRAVKHSVFGDFVASELRSLSPHESDALRMILMRAVMTFLENRPPAVLELQQSPMMFVDENGQEVAVGSVSRVVVMENESRTFARPEPRHAVAIQVQTGDQSHKTISKTLVDASDQATTTASVDGGDTEYQGSPEY